MQAWKSITQHVSESVHIVAGDPPEEIPFIHYAAAALTLYVLKLEEEDGSSDDIVDLLRRLKLSDWRNVSRMEHVVEADWFEDRARFTNLLQWLCFHGFEKTFGAVLPPIEEDTVAEEPKSAAFQLLNTTNEIGETPLMLAAETGYAHIVSQLLAYGARV
jgi:hypothetical protein